MEGNQIGIRVAFADLTRADANRAVQELRRVVLERADEGVVASIECADPDNQDAGTLLAVFFSSAAGAGVAQAIRTYLARRPDERDRITILTADGTQVIATGEAARTIEAAALLRAVARGGRSRHVVLFVAADPFGCTPLALDQECAAIERELRMTAHRDDFDLRSRWAVNVDDLARHLMELSPTILHVSGHGARSAAAAGASGAHRDVVIPAAGGAGTGTGTGGIHLHDDARGPHLVSGRALAMMIRSAVDSVRLVVLNACYGDAQAEALRSVVDCVVGMTGAISDDAARAFAIGLYRALGNRRSVAGAVEHAVAMLAAKQLPDEQLPRYRTRDGVDARQLVLGPPG